jgi:predicted nucleic acid-binding protein
VAAPVEAFVVDASVAAKWYLRDEPDVDRALLLLMRFGRGKSRLVAPEAIRLEVASFITVATRGREPRLTPAQGRAALDALSVLRIETVASHALIRPAYELVLRYDAVYLALAQHLGLPFITADRRLYLKIRSLPEAIWIAQYSPATT